MTLNAQPEATPVAGTIAEDAVLDLVGPAPKANPACPICHGTGVQVIQTSPIATMTRACPACFPPPKE
jgi:hypothetical protein